MNYKAGIITSNESDLSAMQEAINILKDYDIDFQTSIINKEKIAEQMPAIAKEMYATGVRVIIAGTRGNANFSNTIASYFNIPTVGVPLRSEKSPNTLATVFSILQQPNEHAVANVALDGAQNAGILAVQILALSDKALQNKILSFKENLKNKILKASQELSQVKFEYKTN